MAGNCWLLTNHKLFPKTARSPYFSMPFDFKAIVNKISPRGEITVTDAYLKSSHQRF
ncbi:MAG: hypothetical protein AAGF83_08540 [Cyanobacteria bacterium P01_G01_bin.67]